MVKVMTSPKDMRVRVTIPAKYVAKTSGVTWDNDPSSHVRVAIEKAFDMTLGRCNWENPIQITATPHQFGVFIALIKELSQGSSLLNDLTYHLFSPQPVQAVHTFDATTNKARHLPLTLEPV